MNKRLEQFLAAENISQSKLSDTLGVARASVSHIISGRNKPSYEFIVSMMRHFPTLNIEWLLTGVGKMYKTSAATAAVSDLQIDANGVNDKKGVQRKVEEEDLFSSQNFKSDTSSTRRESQISTDLRDITRNSAATQSSDLTQIKGENPVNQKVIDKIMVFYSDNTFIEIK